MIGAFVFPLLYCLLLGTSWALFFKKNFLDSLAPAIILHIIIVLLCGMVFHRLTIGVYGGIIAFCALLYYKSNDIVQDAQSFIKKMCTEDICIFISIYILCFIINIEKRFYAWDDFSHWGMFLKESLRLDALYAESNLPFWHRDYVPAPTLFEAIWCKLIGRNFLEEYALKAIQILMLAMILPIFRVAVLKGKYEDNRFDRVLKIAAAVAFTLAIPILFTVQDFYHAICVDYALGVAFFYCLMNIVRDDYNENYKNIILLLAFTFVLLMKMTGIIFFFMSFVFWGSEKILFQDKNYVVKAVTIKKSLQNLPQTLGTRASCPRLHRCFEGGTPSRLKVLKPLSKLFLLFFLPLFLWISYANFVDQFSSKDYLEYYGGIQSYNNVGILKLFPNGKMIFGDYFFEIGKEFINALFSKSILFGMPYAVVILGMASIVSMLPRFIKRSSSFKKKTSFVACFILISGVSYTFLVYILYLIAFPVHKAVILSSYERYMASFVISIILLIVFIWYQEKIWSKLASILIISLFVILAPDLFRIPNVILEYRSSVWEEDIGKKIASVVPEEESIYIIRRERDIRSILALRFYAHPRIINGGSAGMSIDGFEEWSSNMSAKELKNVIERHHYLYLASLDDKFIEKYSKIFEDTAILKNGNLYRVEDNNIGARKVKLTPIAYIVPERRMISKMFLRRGVDINATDEHGDSLLSHAAWYGKSDIIEVLLDKEKINDTPLSYPRLLEKVESVERFAVK